MLTPTACCVRAKPAVFRCARTGCARSRLAHRCGGACSDAAPDYRVGCPAGSASVDVNVLGLDPDDQPLFVRLPIGIGVLSEVLLGHLVDVLVSTLRRALG